MAARPSLLTRGVRLLKAGLDAAAEVTIEIRADGESLEDLCATPGRKDFAQYLADEYRGSSVDFEWIVAADDLRFSDGVKREPAAGWEIRRALPDGRVAVLLASATTGARAFDPVDQLGILYRIHSLLDRIEDAP